MRRVLISGSTGMLGRYVRQKAEEAGYDLILPTRSEMDLADAKGIYSYICAAKPDFVLHLAAATDVDLCEREPIRAGILNHVATGAVARAARDTKAWLLYISTSNVFGHEGKTIYNELDIPFPVNYYGRSKLFGEKEIEKIYPNDSLVIRASWMIGGGRDHDHKFVGKVIKQIENKESVIQAVNDKYGTITSAPSLANFIIFALKNRTTGLAHFASTGVTSRFDIAIEIARILNFQGSVKPVLSSNFPLSAPRPVFEGISSIYLNEYDGFRVETWRDSLLNYITSGF